MERSSLHAFLSEAKDLNMRSPRSFTVFAARDDGSRARTILVVLAIAVGIAGFAAVLASYAILTRELNRGYLATNPASATLRTDKVDDALLAAVAANRDVRDVEARRAVSGRIRGGTAGWRNLLLFVVNDFNDIRVGKLNRESGAWPPATGEILIERDAFQVARAKIGDNVIVRTTNGPERTLRVSGGVHDVGQAQARMENMVYGYITKGTLAQLGEEPLLNRVLIAVPGDKQHVESVAAEVKTIIESRGHAVTHVDVPVPGKHPHADIMGLLLLSLASFGLFVMILSGVIVVNLLTALMAAQIRQIGVMKAIGGTRWQIARIYFTQALLLGVAALVIAVPAGVWGSRTLCQAMAKFLNFDITSFAIPFWVYFLVAIAGLVVPLLAAAFPVWRGSSVSVRRALADFGVAGNHFGASAFDRLLAGVGGIARPMLLSIRNSFRRRARLALTIATLAAGGLFFMTALNLRASMINTLDHLFETRRFDLAISISGSAPADVVDRIVRNTRGVCAAEEWMVESNDRFTLVSLPPQTKELSPNIIRGRWLRASDRDVMVVNSALASKLQPRIGDRIDGSLVVGIAREPFAPAAAYAAQTSGVTNSVRIVLDRNDAASIDRAKGLLEENLTREGIKVSSISSKGDTRFGFDQHMVMIYVALIIMSALIGGVGGLGLMTTMSLNVLERRREMGVLRAIGASPRVIWLMLVGEGAVVGIASWALASLAAYPLSKGLGNFLIGMMFRSGLDFTFELRGVAIWLAISLLLGAIASLIPAWHASRQPVREALGYE
jgi:putative ABC transport system permease protein